MYLGDTDLWERLRENESHNKKGYDKNMPGNAFELGLGTRHCFAPNLGGTQTWASVKSF